MSDFRLEMSDGKTIIGTKSVREAGIPSDHDTTAMAEKYRRRNRGKTHTNHRFNLPYATSLEGAGRWTTPTRLTTLPTDPFDGRPIGPIAHQTSGPFPTSRAGWRINDGKGKQPFDWHDWGAVESEDCCWITIDTPAPYRGANLPVRFQMKGGGNTQNPRMLPRTTGEELPMVSVMAESPLSTFGFFTHPSLGPNHQINLAYSCILAALDWVRENIADFGGNPSRVMNDGGSAGAQMGTLLMPHHADRFHSVLAHSGAGAGKRATRARAEGVGQEFWGKLVKTRPAFYDRSRTIHQVADQDGIATALRLGPSPEQILAFANRRNSYVFADGGYDRESLPDLNIWPAQDGTIIQHRTAIGAVLDGAWPTSVPYMAGYVSNEAGLIDNARNVVNGDDWFGVLGIGPDDYDEAIALLEKPGDRWQRILYGMLYGYGAERLCREHSLAGGKSYFYHFELDTAANGRDAPSHVNQQAHFVGKPEWQSAQGQSEGTAILYEAQLRSSAWCSQSLVNFAANGDPNDPFITDLTPDYYDPQDLAMFDEWAEFGGEARNCNVIGNATSEVSGAAMKVERDHQRPFFDFVDARYDPS